MKFPKGITRCAAPKRSNHAGRVWDLADLTLPNGAIALAHYDMSYGQNFYFEIDGVWRKGSIDLFGQDSGRHIKFDLRDAAALDAVEKLTVAYEEALCNGDEGEIERLCYEVEEAATKAGYNNHRRLAALHTWAEGFALKGA
ncbi:hypothetical protein CcrColossus_gp341 [Caulobacter phage CcrColossus]|uniref:Uncharacterized protein n=1 Tax=Caulobacter phage CcrColossus TaxID=1211640 RepID=K4JSU5_9CAUD|nr:hypothetical protein CcrColossus_gp341 [Caulobacter phage CcrColossus]AFU88211.1 hypothetical protein CcrColossus_gp341 [Caulobacter phage CcrColossus]